MFNPFVIFYSLLLRCNTEHLGQQYNTTTSRNCRALLQAGTVASRASLCASPSWARGHCHSKPRWVPSLFSGTPMWVTSLWTMTLIVGHTMGHGTTPLLHVFAFLLPPPPCYVVDHGGLLYPLSLKAIVAPLDESGNSNCYDKFNILK
jgi:hypothetical protein